MPSNGSTSLRISGAKKRVAESIALEISIECEKVVKISDVLNFVLDRYLNTEMIPDFIEKLKIEHKKELELKKSSQEKRKYKSKKQEADDEI